MSTTVRELFNHVGINHFGKAKWGERFYEKKQGIYVVSISSDPDTKIDNNFPDFDVDQIERWISKLPSFKVDGVSANVVNVKNRLTSFWLVNETILYIGKAPTRKSGSGVGQRVVEYYNTVIGDGGPHSGGQWIKALKLLHKYTVYYAGCDDPDNCENKMLEYFMSNVKSEYSKYLFDSKMPIPFANIKFKGNKKHGFKDQRL